MNAKCPLPALAAALSAAIASAVAAAPAALPDDPKPAAMRAYGLREAAPLSPTEIRVVIGAAATASADRADAWRILSDKDPAYSYTTFARPKSVRKIAQADEFPLPAGDASPKPARRGALRAVAVAIELPSPMKDGATYTVVAHGSPSMQNLLVTGGRADASFTFRSSGPFAKEELPPPTDEARAAAGLRGVWSVGGGIVRLECGAGLVPPACDDPSAYTVTRNGAPAPVRSIGRRSRIDLYKPEYWPFHVLMMHDVFLDLGTPLKAGDRVRVSVSPSAMAAGAAAEAELAFDEKSSVSDSIKANQAGYLPDAIKFARLGRWLGTMPKGALDLPSPPPFEVRDAATHAVAFSGTARPTHRRGEKDARPGDLSGENVWEMDFTKLAKPGRYYVAVPGVGRSFDFRIAADAYAAPFAVAATGLVAQRCGIELREPWFPWNRVSCHDKGLVPTTAPHGTPLGKLPGMAEPGAAKLDARGGHHDAGDYNPRSHLDVAQALLDAYDAAPRKFRDGQMPVPPNERANGVPDVVDEALWELRLWCGLQDADGGVRGGTEANGDPNRTSSRRSSSTRSATTRSPRARRRRSSSPAAPRSARASSAPAGRGPPPSASSPAPPGRGTGPRETRRRRTTRRSAASSGRRRAPTPPRTCWPRRARRNTTRRSSPRRRGGATRTRRRRRTMPGTTAPRPTPTCTPRPRRRPTPRCAPPRRTPSCATRTDSLAPSRTPRIRSSAIRGRRSTGVRAPTRTCSTRSSTRGR